MNLKGRKVKFAAALMIWLMIFVIVPQGYFFGLSLGTGLVRAQSSDGCTAAGGTGCEEIQPTGNNQGKYFARGYCSGANDVQCKYTAPSITDCNSCISAGNKKWCYTSSTGYCSSNTGASGFTQDCLSGYSIATTSAQCSNPPSTGGSGVTNYGIDINPKNPQPNTPVVFIISFATAPALMQNTQVLIELQGKTTGDIQTIPIAVSNFCPQREGSGATCRAPQRTLKADTYDAYVRATSSDGKTQIVSDKIIITVGAPPSGGTTAGPSQSTGNICRDCQAKDGTWCVGRDNAGSPKLYCATLGHECSLGDTPYYDNCPEGGTLCVQACSSYYATTYAQFNSPTRQTTAVGLPFGACYSNDLQVNYINVQIANGRNVNEVFLRPPFQIPTQGLCADKNDACWCAILQAGSDVNGGGSSTIPGTTRTPHWPPDENYYVQDKPKAEANTVDCSKQNDVSIRASVAGAAQQGNSLSIVAAGQPVTLEGEVGYFSNVCDGYKYTCERFQELGCEYKKEAFKQVLDYHKCPTQLPERLAAEGRKEETCIGCIVSAIVTFVAIATSIVLAVVPGGQVFIPMVISGAQCLNSLAPALDKPSCANYGMAISSCAAAVYSIPSDSGKAPPVIILPGSVKGKDGDVYYYCYETKSCKPAKPSSEFNTTYAEAACGKGGGTGPFESLEECSQVNAKEPGVGTAVKTGTEAFAKTAPYGLPAFSCPLIDDNDYANCWSVCGKEYETTAAAAPRCNQGGDVRSYASAQYVCALRNCGNFAGRDVIVSVMSGDQEVLSGITVTDENGKFSYTFTAPNIDAAVRIVLSTSV